MIRRTPRSTLSSSSAASDVYKRQIRNCIAVNESNTTFEPLLSYDKKCPASLDYVELVNYLGLMDTAHYRKLARYLKGEK